MLVQAHTLAGGRRVFKTLDGTKVFDENGAEVSSDEIRPEDIADFRKRFEPYWTDYQLREDLRVERDELHEFQDKLDQACDHKNEQGFG